MALVWAWVGAPTPSGAVVTVEVETGPATLLVADNDAMSSPAEFPPVDVDADGVAKLVASGLSPGTQYWYQIQDDGATDTSLTGKFRTLPSPGSAASFEVVVASCAGAGGEYPGELGDELDPTRVSNATVFDTIRQRDPEMFVWVGDRGYYDLASGLHGITGGASEANFLKAHQDNIRQPRQLALMSQIPTQWVADDHDLLANDAVGVDDPDGREAFLSVYHRTVPSYLLGGTDTATDQYWQIGRVAFILSDLRTDSDATGDPDVPGKSMMGTAQKARFEAFLASSTAEALVWLMPRQWLGVSDDSWAAYTHERDELVDLLDQYGWLSNMVCAYGDRHALGLDAGSQQWGGFPVLQAASLDTSFPSSPVVTRFDTGPDQPGRNQYGVITVDDNGATIDVTLAGYVGAALWRQHTHTVVVEEAESEAGAAPIATAKIRRRLTWLGVHAVTGQIIAELPDVRGEVSRLLSSATTSRLDLPIPLGGPAAVPPPVVEQATQPVGSAIVAVVNDLPMWMGWIVVRRGGTAATVRLSCVTPEGYLLRRRVRDHMFTARDRAEVAAELLADAGDIAGIGKGLGFQIDAPAVGDLVDREYVATDRVTVYDALRELCGSSLEFTVDLDWTDADRTAVRKIFRIRPRIGAALAAPQVFEASGVGNFESQSGSDATYTLTEDYSDGKYGNYIVAYARGEGEDQPASEPALDTAALDGGTPIVERHWQPSITTMDTTVLDLHAQQALTRLSHGAQVWEIDARLDAYPRPGVDVLIGDDVAWQLKGHRHPDGVTGHGRMLGYHLDHASGRWRPILLDPQEGL